jgi:hypothetical protein
LCCCCCCFDWFFDGGAFQRVSTREEKDKIKKKGFKDICVEGKKKLCALMSRAVDGRTDGGIVMDGKFQRILAVVFLAR